MTSSFKWLEDIVKARTPGKWYKVSGSANYVRIDAECGRQIAAIPHVVYCGENEGRAGSQACMANSEFTATMGTVADLLMDVVKAADRLWQDETGSPLSVERQLWNALEALKQAKEKK